MRAGRLDRTIELQRPTFIEDGYGGGIAGPAVTFMTLRAQLIETSTEEFIRGAGASAETVAVFRTRWTNEVLLSDEVRYEGQRFNILATKEIGRRRGLELRCRAVGQP